MLVANKKRIFFTVHARQRMIQRGISEKIVQRALSTHHTSVPGRNDTVKYMAEVDGDEFQVVVEEHSKKYLVITVCRRS